jgi:hypothetical protein
VRFRAPLQPISNHPVRIFVFLTLFACDNTVDFHLLSSAKLTSKMASEAFVNV